MDPVTSNPYPTGPTPLLEPLPYPVYFVCKRSDRWGELMNSDTLPADPAQFYQRSLDATDIWSAQTYLTLKLYGLNVHLVPTYVPGQICLTTYEQLAAKDLPYTSYVVTSRHDRPRPEMCAQRIVLNRLNVEDATDHYVDHWPQPNQQPRDPQRGSRVEVLVFKGMRRNLAYPFKDPAFAQALATMGIEFRCASEDPNQQFDDWSDYREADVVLAVRNNTAYDLTLKPALKLINAWFADCPAILGPEPAYRALRQNDLDYIEARSPQEVLAALQRLKDDPGLYQAMVDNGRQRRQDFTPAVIAQAWRDILAGPVAEGYERWTRQNGLQRILGRPLQFARQVRRHRQNQKRYRANIATGERLFPEPPPAQA